jgi:hypothetical protein
MGKSPKSALVIWLAAALSLIGFVAGFNIVVDPFGYFGNNTIGYYFSSERQFKYSLIKSYDYDAIVLGDSRVAYTDTSAIGHPEYSFVNGGMAATWLSDYVTLLSASRLDRLELVIIGTRYRDVARCSNSVPAGDGGVTPPSEYGPWDAMRFAASLRQFAYSLEALVARAGVKTPRFRPDGMREVSSAFFGEALRRYRKTEQYWKQVEMEAIEEKAFALPAQLGTECLALLKRAQDLADQHGFALLLVFLPANSDVLERLNWNTPEMQDRIRRLLAEIEEVVPHVVDLSTSPLSDSRNFFSDDATHFRPLIGARALQEAISLSFGTPQARK